MVKKASIYIYVVFMAAVVVWKWLDISSSYGSLGKPVDVQLTRGTFTVCHFPASISPRAVVIFGSGDGGWGMFEEQMCRALQSHGCDVTGVDFRSYASTDYSLATLQADFSRIAMMAEHPYGARRPPLIVAGYSMGAAQAIAVGGGPNPPAGLAGLLLVDPCSRGRYGLRFSDQADILPTGPGTFAVDDFAGTMPQLRVVQWHAAEDPIDSRAWLENLPAAHREYEFNGTGHLYTNGRADFLRRMVASVDWLLPPPGRIVANRGAR